MKSKWEQVRDHPVLADEALDDLQRGGDVHAAPSEKLDVEVLIV